MLVKILVTAVTTVSVAATTGVAAINANSNTAADVTVETHAVGYEKDQCKNGGWRTLGYRNQGQCVSFFASGQDESE